ncbi:hypothetical protein HYFRA_00003984 [Hymenoscyphus fraxineus]|uniref:T6SS Phospholipase effector Tle1-like catalytic domain-containing protein n=1 Tax=Hymenoscyphus fraxineus TaxID=746836 RepID=A0A9N9KMF8_9HELO|nr:hypothetical protein HYFRA_00003984 [Hymenoscyphus fraxineus]
MPPKKSDPVPDEEEFTPPKSPTESVKKGTNDSQKSQDARKKAIADSKLKNQQHLLLFCDGTGKDAGDAGSAKSNVYRLFKLIGGLDPDGRAQATFYQQGLGTDPEYNEGLGGIGKTTLDFVAKVAGNAGGHGIEDNIALMYYLICTKLKEGDKLSLFGFSRGAYTVRIIAALVASVGICNPKHFGQTRVKQLDGLLNLVRQWRKGKGKLENSKMKEIMPNLKEVVEIHAIGVWDTVASVAFKDYTFALDLSPKIQNAFQALAINERRPLFAPEVFKKPASIKSMKQCWFFGTHSAVGGGTGQQDIAVPDISLLWMISQLEGLVGIDKPALREMKLFAMNFSKAKGADVVSQIKQSSFISPKEIGKDRKPGLGINEFIHISVRLFEDLTPVKSRGATFGKVLNPEPRSEGGRDKTWTWTTADGKELLEDIPKKFEAERLKPDQAPFEGDPPSPTSPIIFAKTDAQKAREAEEDTEPEDEEAVARDDSDSGEMPIFAKNKDADSEVDEPFARDPTVFKPRGDNAAQDGAKLNVPASRDKKNEKNATQSKVVKKRK